MVDLGKVPYHEHDDSDIREALANALNENRSNRWRKRVAAYLFMVVVVGFLFWQNDRTTDNLCTGATENREAIRAVVQGVGNLGRGLILDGAAQPSTPEQGTALLRIDRFEDEQLQALELPVCN